MAFLLVKDNALVVKDNALRIGAEDDLCCCAFVCDPDLLEGLTDEQIEDMYPSAIEATPGNVDICGCHVGNPGPGGEESTTFDDTGFNGHAYTLTPGPLSRDGDGHYRDYAYYSLHRPYGSPTSTGDTQIGSARKLGVTDCSGVEANLSTDDQMEVSFGVRLRCRDSTGWRYTVNSSFVAASAATIWETAAGVSETAWDGGALIASVPNDLVYADCINPSPAGGDGEVVFTAVPPGIP